MNQPAFSEDRDEAIAQAYRDISEMVMAIAEADGKAPENSFGADESYVTGPHDITRRADPEQSVSCGLHLHEYTLKEVTEIFKGHGFKPTGVPLPKGFFAKPCVIWKCGSAFHEAMLIGEKFPHNPLASFATSTGTFAPAWSLFTKPIGWQRD